MDVEIILNQNDLYGITEVNVGYLFEKVCIVNGRAPICDLDVPPPFKRSKNHEEIGRAVAKPEGSNELKFVSASVPSTVGESLFE